MKKKWHFCHVSPKIQKRDCEKVTKFCWDEKKNRQMNQKRNKQMIGLAKACKQSCVSKGT